ncbi:MAG TPA: hypothetical protein VHQ64_12510 [Pyrinomonadaceae bacterium]|jgi:hypothetical protein|nr:hypothetical protein [Pyrinomonadaceae bacterium]
MRIRIAILLSYLLIVAPSANAFLEDLCQSRGSGPQTLGFCVQPVCPAAFGPNRACPAQLYDFATIKPGRSMIHADSTYFIAQALGYRADVAYWITAYNEVTDYAQYKPLDQCGNEASSQNTGRKYISAYFNGFQRTMLKTDGPLDHYVVSFSPNGQGTDVHGAGGVQSLYPLHYPQPGYPVNIDDTYQKTLANARQWAMLPGPEPGTLCTVGLTSPDGKGCLTGTISGNVPLIMKSAKGIPLNVAAGKKVLNYDKNTKTYDYYEQLGVYLKDKRKTIGTLWQDPNSDSVPVQLARIALYLHMLQDTSSHATYCGDDAPTPPGGSDPGTFMFLSDSQTNAFKVSFGSSCASSPHLASHVQETGTGNDPLPLRDYVALNNTVDELIVFGNEVALKHPGWIVNRELLPPNLVEKNQQGFTAGDLKTELIGAIVSGTPFSRAEIYRSGIITSPLQLVDALQRLHAMNRALGEFSERLHKRSKHPSSFSALEPMPGNSFDPQNSTVCWR